MVVTTGSPSHSQHDDKDPNPTESQQSPPHSETLDFRKSPQSPLNDQIVQTSQQSDDHEDTLTISDGYDQQSGGTRTTLPEPIVLSNDTKNPLRSPTNHRLQSNQRKKRGIRKKPTSIRLVAKKIENLTVALNPIPFIPKVLDLDKHEDVLKRLGLYEFSITEFDRSIRTDLLVQLIVNYDSKKHCSYVNEKRIIVSRAALARALKLPGMKQDKGSRRVEVDLDSEMFSDETIGFIEDFVFNWMLLHEESWVMPAEILNWTRCIRDGHPEKLNSASLIWYKVEKELAQGVTLADCYYASHLQCLIRSQKGELFKVKDGGGAKKEVVKADVEQDEKEEHHKKEEQEVKVSIVQESDVGLNLGQDVEKTVHQEVRKDDETIEDTEEFEGDEADILLEHEQQQDEQQIPIPPMPARTIIRQIPPTPQYMSESIQLMREMHTMQREMHEMQRWSIYTLHTIAWRQEYHLTPRPVMGPFVPQPWTGDGQADPQPSGTHDDVVPSF